MLCERNSGCLLGEPHEDMHILHKVQILIISLAVPIVTTGPLHILVAQFVIIIIEICNFSNKYGLVTNNIVLIN
jgi:hypothetical protein